MPLDLSQLPKEVQDTLIMKEDTEPTFGNALSQDYTEILFDTIEERKDRSKQHSYIASWYGRQGCWSGETQIIVKRNGILRNISIKDIKLTDKVLSFDGKKTTESKISKKFRYKNKQTVKISLKYGEDLVLTPEHKLYVFDVNKFVKKKVSNLKKDDYIIFWKGKTKKIVKDEDYYKGIIHGMYLADGANNDGAISKTDKGIINFALSLNNKVNFEIRKTKTLRVDKKVIEEISALSGNKCIRNFKSNSYLDGVLYGYVLCDSEIRYDKKVKNGKLCVCLCSKSKRLLQQIQTMLLIRKKIPTTLLSYKFGGKTKYKNNIYHNLKFDSKSARQFLSCFDWFGRKKKIVDDIFKKYKNINPFTDYRFKLPLKYWEWVGKDLSKRGSITRKNGFGDTLRRTAKRGFIQENNLRNWVEEYPIIKERFERYLEVFNNWYCLKIKSIQKYKKIDVYDIHIPKYNNYILSNGLLSSNSGKSWSALALAGILDPDFNISKIFFDIEVLVNKRNKLKEHDCVVVDEMARTFGVDSMRINIMLNTIKEQLRKKSIHMFYCSPTLKEEYKSSMYVLETMFIDVKNKMTFHAYKTNQLLTLGYVIIPHPLHFISKKLLLQYERKKDTHLKQVLEGPKDLVEERAQLIIKNPFFVKAEKMYYKARGYIPYKILVQIVEKIYPEFKGSIIVYELADRIKADKEIEGSWLIFGSKKE